MRRSILAALLSATATLANAAMPAATDALKAPVPYEKYVDDSFAKAVKPTVIPL